MLPTRKIKKNQKPATVSLQKILTRIELYPKNLNRD